MKRIITVLLCIVSTMSFVSCSLEDKSFTNVDMATYMEDAAQAESVLMGVYNQMTKDGLYSLCLSSLFTMPTDLAKPEGASTVGMREQSNNAFSTTDLYVQTMWQTLYQSIYYANNFLEAIEAKIEGFSENDQQRSLVYIAEAKALRALFYFELVRWYGNIPLITKTSQSANETRSFKQEDPVKVYEFIERDLLDAIDILPYATADNIRSNNSYRFSKGAALGLLVKVYATWAGYPLKDTSKWESAATVAEELINSGKHKLLPSFKTLWENAGASVWNPDESLIEVSFWSPQSTNSSSGRIGKFNGVMAETGSIKGTMNTAFVRCQPTFLANWKDYDKDQRWALTFADYKYTNLNGKTGIVSAKIDGETTHVTFAMAMDDSHPNWTADWRRYYSYQLTPSKWDTEIYVPDSYQLQDNNRSNVNWYVLRYSDVLLLYAEAINEIHGPNQDAYKYLNMVRRRAFGNDVNASSNADLSGFTQEEFRQAIRDERAYELAYEGHRRQDLIRWGIYVDTIEQTYQGLMSWHETAPDYFIAVDYTKKNKHELLPIPQREVDLCGFSQNLGWK